MIRAVALAAAAAALLPLAAVAGPSAADDQRAHCLAEPVGDVTPQQVIAACDAVVQSGTVSGGELGGILDARGVGYGVAGRPARALQNFDAALKLVPTSEEAWYGRGAALFRLGLLSRALDAYDRAIELNTNLGQAYMERGEVYLLTSRTTLALADFDDAALLIPDSYTTFLGRGYVYAETGRYALALADYDRALALKPNDVETLGARDRAKAAQADWEQRLAAPDPATPAPDVADVPARAVGRTHDCTRLYPQVSASIGETGMTEVQYDIETDGKIANVAVVRSSGAPRLDQAAVDCVSMLWRSTPAIANHVAVPSLRHLANINFTFHEPSAPITAQLADRGAAFTALGQYDQAVAAYSQAIAANAGSADNFYHRGIAYYGLGQMDQAIADFARALKLAPDMVIAADARDLAKGIVDDVEKPAPARRHHGR